MVVFRGMTWIMPLALFNNPGFLRFLTGAVIGAVLATSTAQAADATVFAAASLKPVLDGLEAQFEETTGNRLDIAYAGTSVLARQIQAGAPADLFISASPEWMDALQEGGFIDAESRVDLIGNRLALVASEAGVTSLDRALSGEDRIAMAFVEAVPAGIYGKAALEALGVWDTIAPRVVQTDNVRVALTLVARGEVPLGIVYASDAKTAARGVVEVAVFDAGLHPEILYPAAMIDGRDSVAAAEFLEYLQSDTARRAFIEAGFSPVPQ